MVAAQNNATERLAVAPYQKIHVFLINWMGNRAAGGGALPKTFSCFPAFLIRSRVGYCTLTSVPTGISEKNLRAVSSGNRMQPCDAG
ncbi:MAG: hypothetical protein DME53_03675 [Verrucomicrobia bacterium]|nr:MAG: hypothetical protein DME53_03675 [Verrucomicrobiota bacterium]